MLSPGHSQAVQVRRLLEAARRACQQQRFVPINDDPVALDVVVRGPVQAPGDATNYLGGVGDVLQDRSASSVPLDHLEHSAGVWLFRNDRQIKQISYREEQAEQASYTVIVRGFSSRIAVVD